MFIRVRCLLCNEVLDSVRNDTTNLLEHIRQKHPNIKLSKVNSEVRFYFIRYIHISNTFS